jgi:hypothetical protein
MRYTTKRCSVRTRATYTRCVFLHQKLTNAGGRPITLYTAISLLSAGTALSAFCGVELSDERRDSGDFRTFCARAPLFASATKLHWMSTLLAGEIQRGPQADASDPSTELKAPCERNRARRFWQILDVY